jgi:hypothetical protein
MEEEDITPLPRLERTYRGALGWSRVVRVGLRGGARGEGVTCHHLVVYANRTTRHELAYDIV